MSVRRFELQKDDQVYVLLNETIITARVVRVYQRTCLVSPYDGSREWKFERQSESREFRRAEITSLLSRDVAYSARYEAVLELDRRQMMPQSKLRHELSQYVLNNAPRMVIDYLHKFYKTENL